MDLYSRFVNRAFRTSRRDAKVFCIGLGKTGTTSLERTFQELGFRVGNQRAGELLIEDWGRRRFDRIIRLAYSAEAFQDVPFSLPYTFQALDQHFPNAKFVLSTRDSAEQWYDSLTRFHSKMWASASSAPTIEELREATYIFEGRPYIANRLIYDTDESDPYEKDTLINFYERHNDNVRYYFRHKPDKLIEINVANDSDYFRLCTFLVRTPTRERFPRLNATDALDASPMEKET